MTLYYSLWGALTFERAIFGMDWIRNGYNDEILACMLGVSTEDKINDRSQDYLL